MQQAFKTMTGQMNTQNNQFGNTVFPLGSPFPFPAPPSAGPDIPRSPSSQCTDTVDAPVRQVEAASVTDPATEVKSVKNETETAEPKKYAFVDVSPKETMHKSAFEDAAELSSPNGIQSSKDVSFLTMELHPSRMPVLLGFPGKRRSRSYLICGCFRENAGRSNSAEDGLSVVA